MIKREFKVNFKSFLIWLFIMFFMFGVVFLVYPSIRSSVNNEMLNEMLKAFPPEMLKAFNMDISGIESVFGWMKTEGYTFYVLIGSIYSAILGGTILCKEESDKSIEFLFSKPITKNKILKSKIISGVIFIVLFTLSITIFNLIGLKLSNDLELKVFLLLSVSPLIVFLNVFIISMLISTFVKKTKTGIMTGIAFVFVAYMFQMIGLMSDKVKFLKNISLFELAPSRYIITNGSFNIQCLVIGIGIFLIVLGSLIVRYNKKEFL